MAYTRSTAPTTSTSSQQSSGSSTTESYVENMDPQSLAALQVLIAQLISGGTPEQRVQNAQRQQEIGSVQAARAGYSKEAAFADAEGAMAAQLRQALQTMMPSITRAAEGAGTSQSSMRALLMQEAAQQAADSAALLGLQNAVNYGQIATGLTGTLEALTRPNDVVTNSLIQALGLAKGATQKSTSSQSSAASSTTTNTQSGSGGYAQPAVSESSGYSGGPIGGTNSLGGGYYSVGPVQQSPTQLDNAQWSALMRNTGSNNVDELASYLASRGGWGGYSAL